MMYSVMYKMDILFYLSVGVMCPVILFLALIFDEYRDLSVNLYLFIPSFPEPIPEPLQLDNLQRNIQVAQDYRNGQSLIDIKKKYGFGHVNTSRRVLVKGIDDLLRFYHDHDGELTA